MTNEPVEAVRAAIAAEDYPALKTALQAACRIEGECWIWPHTNHRGYPNVSPREWGLHRRVVELEHGKPLGKQHAHHTCGVRACVNPDHLEPASRRANIAEMQERRTYRRRIAELEAALRELAPNHPTLNVIQLTDP